MKFMIETDSLDYFCERYADRDPERFGKVEFVDHGVEIRVKPEHYMSTREIAERYIKDMHYDSTVVPYEISQNRWGLKSTRKVPRFIVDWDAEQLAQFCKEVNGFTMFYCKETEAFTIFVQYGGVEIFE